MILTSAQADVVARMAATFNSSVAVEDAFSVAGCITVTPSNMYASFSDPEYQYLVDDDGSIIRLGGPEGMVSVDKGDFHVIGTDGCECPDAVGETCPRHGSPGDRR